MKGTIISGEEVLKRVSTGKWSAVKGIYAIYAPAGNVSIAPIVNKSLGAIINDYSDPKIMFVEIEEAQR